MRTGLDFSSWQAVLTTLIGIVLVSLVAVGIRLLLMHSVQLRRERQNRQINERPRSRRLRRAASEVDKIARPVGDVFDQERHELT